MILNNNLFFLGAAGGAGLSKLSHGLTAAVSHSSHLIKTVPLAPQPLVSNAAASTVLPSNSLLNNTQRNGRMNSKNKVNSHSKKAGGLSSPKKITKGMLNQLQKQLAKSINPKLTYCEWYEKQVLGQKVAVLTLQYKENLRLMEALSTQVSQPAAPSKDEVQIPREKLRRNRPEAPHPGATFMDGPQGFVFVPGEEPRRNSPEALHPAAIFMDGAQGFVFFPGEKPRRNRPEVPQPAATFMDGPQGFVFVPHEKAEMNRPESPPQPVKNTENSSSFKI